MSKQSCLRAGNGTRTRDPNLGKVVLYQLSYSREDRNIPVEKWVNKRITAVRPARARRTTR
jgi:hypothetical protein